MRTLIFSAVLAICSTASARPGPEANVYPFKSSGSLNLLDDVALNATAATRTITLNMQDGGSDNRGRWSKLRVFVFFTYAAATTVTAQMTCSLDGTNYGRKTSRATNAGTSTVYLQSDSYTTGAADADLMLEYDVRGCAYVKVLFGGASAGASDLVDVQAVAMVGN